MPCAQLIYLVAYTDKPLAEEALIRLDRALSRQWEALALPYTYARNLSDTAAVALQLPGRGTAFPTVLNARKRTERLSDDRKRYGQFPVLRPAAGRKPFCSAVRHAASSNGKQECPRRRLCRKRGRTPAADGVLSLLQVKWLPALCMEVDFIQQLCYNIKEGFYTLGIFDMPNEEQMTGG